jgi:hypothetical protein
MNKTDKKLLRFLVIFLLVVGVCCARFSPRFFIDRQRVSGEFSLELTDDVKLVSYQNNNRFFDSDSELVVDVDDAESFVKNNVKSGLIKILPGNFYDYKYRDDENISIRIEPHFGKYRVYLYRG